MIPGVKKSRMRWIRISAKANFFHFLRTTNFFSPCLKGGGNFLLLYILASRTIYFITINIFHIFYTLPKEEQRSEKLSNYFSLFSFLKSSWKEFWKAHWQVTLCTLQAAALAIHSFGVWGFDYLFGGSKTATNKGNLLFLA